MSANNNQFANTKSSSCRASINKSVALLAIGAVCLVLMALCAQAEASIGLASGFPSLYDYKST